MNSDETARMTDRDMLVRLLERTEFIQRALEMLKTEIEDVKSRVTALERNADRQSGFLSGVTWLKTLLFTLPPSVLGLFWWNTK